MVYKFFFPKRLPVKDYVDLVDRMALESKVDFRKTWRYASEMHWKRTPSIQKRIDKMESIRLRDQVEVRRIVSTIFSRKKIPMPPSSLERWNIPGMAKDEDELE